jgi:hypothetical protein
MAPRARLQNKVTVAAIFICVVYVFRNFLALDIRSQIKSIANQNESSPPVVVYRAMDNSSSFPISHQMQPAPSQRSENSKDVVDSIRAQEHEKKNGADADAFSKLQLFVPTFPDGFEEFQITLVQSLRFFWPRESFNTLVVLDDTAHNTEIEKENMTTRVKSFFREDLKDRVEVAYNPRSNKTLFKKGWNIQQLIMFWADNFTTAEFIGFVDDDTLFTKAVIPYDVFDSLGRPRALVTFPTDRKGNYQWFNATNYSLGTPGYVDAMTNFPLIIRREHLAEVRQAVMKQHPEFS